MRAWPSPGSPTSTSSQRMTSGPPVSVIRIDFGMAFSHCRLRPGSFPAIGMFETPQPGPSAAASSANEDRGRGTRGGGCVDSLDAQNLALLPQDQEVRKLDFIGTDPPARCGRRRIEEMGKESVVIGLLARSIGIAGEARLFHANDPLDLIGGSNLVDPLALPVG